MTTIVMASGDHALAIAAFSSGWSIICREAVLREDEAVLVEEGECAIWRGHITRDARRIEIAIQEIARGIRSGGEGQALRVRETLACAVTVVGGEGLIVAGCWGAGGAFAAGGASGGGGVGSCSWDADCGWGC